MNKTALEILIEVIEKFGDGTNHDPFLNNPAYTPFTLQPFLVKDIQPPPAKLRLSYDAPVSDEFRGEMNKWLLDMFGRQDPIDPMLRILTEQAFGVNVIKRPEAVMLHTGV